MSSRLRSVRWLLAAIPATIIAGSLASERDGADGTSRHAATRIAYASSFAPARLSRVDSAFAKLVQRLSEPGGYFDSDNLMSNETSHLHVLDALRRPTVRGGAYIAVG